MDAHKIKVQKTARYYTLGTPGPAIKHVWVVCHGYAQLAKYFLHKFRALESDSVMIVAPEGMNRFYQEQFSGRVVASWMTSEDRLDEITDYVAFIDRVMEELLPKVPNIVQLHLLGFSQGTATASRWAAHTSHKISSIILWGGGPAAEILQSSALRSSRLFVVAGDNDQFISEAKLNSELEQIRNAGLDPELIRYVGRHEIENETLSALAARLTN